MHCVGLAPALPVYLLGWALIGVGMGTGLYDAVFAALGRMYGSEARGPITNLTLFGGFASTICWPLSAFMIEHVGWRVACLDLCRACISFVSLPLQMSVVRKRRATTQSATPDDDETVPSRSGSHNETAIFALLALVLSIAAGIGSIVIVHLHDLPAGEGRGLRRGGQPRHAVRPVASRRARGRTVVRQSLSPDLDDDRVLHPDGGRPVDAVSAACRRWCSSSCFTAAVTACRGSGAAPCRWHCSVRCDFRG